MKVFLQGTGPVELSQSHFVATGGQASVWVKDGVAYKIYTDPKAAIPAEKVKVLSAIADPAVIKPQALLLDAKNRNVGYAMAAAAAPWSLCQLFVPAFRAREKVPDDASLRLSADLRSHVLSVHRAGCQVVDLNELNVLVAPRFDGLYLIDVDSYQTPGFPAAVIMPSVRDWSQKAFDEKSDWFSYAILTFQLFIGAHPFKGRIDHPEIDSVPRDERMEWRMKRNLSAFRPKAKLADCCPSFDVIPVLLRDWLRVVLDEGKRLPPPDLHAAAAVVGLAPPPPRTLSSVGELLLELFEGYAGFILAVEDGFALSSSNGTLSATLGGVGFSGDWMNGLGSGRVLLGFTPKMRRPIALRHEANTLVLYDFVHKTREVLLLAADELSRSGERFYARCGEAVFELGFLELKDRTSMATVQQVASVLPLACRLFEGCVIQSMLGSTFVSLFPKSRQGHQLRMAELDGYKILDAKFQAASESGARGAGGVLGVLGAKGGKYDRLTFRFDERFQGYDVRTAFDVEPGLVNFVVLPQSGVVADLGTDDVLEVYVAKKGHSSLRRIESPVLGRDLRLMRVGDGIGFTRGSEVWRMRLS